MKKYHHVGIPTTSPRPGEVHLDQFKVYCTDHESNPYGIQWMRFEPDSPLPELVKTVPPVAFIVEDGAPVEFVQFGVDISIPPSP